MEKEKIIIDCDPGVDDALAIILALSTQNIDLKAICSVSGNGTIDTTTKNALKVLKLCNRENIPVYKGFDKALNNQQPQIVEAFKDDGLGGYANTILTDKKEEEQNSVDFLVDYINKNPKQITIFAIGPCTNIALAIRKSKDFAKNIKKLIIMGGAKNTGNMSPVAEYNFWADPQAASEVLKAEIEDVMVIGLDITNQIALNCEMREIIRLQKTLLGDFIYNITQSGLDDNYKTRKKAVSPMHDVLTIAYFIQPDILEYKPANIEVVIDGIAKGQSIIDFNGHWNNNKCNAKYATSVNVDKFYKLFFTNIFNQKSF